jgi:hypothetical protein
MRTFKRAKTLADLPQELDISIPSFSIDNSNEVKSLLSDLSSTHSEKIKIIFENNLDDEELMNDFYSNVFETKRNERIIFDDNIKFMSEDFLEDVMKDVSKKNSLMDNDTKLDSVNLRTPTVSIGFNESALKLKNDLKGDATDLNPDNYTVTDKNDTERSNKN